MTGVKVSTSVDDERWSCYEPKRQQMPHLQRLTTLRVSSPPGNFSGIVLHTCSEPSVAACWRYPLAAFVVECLELSWALYCEAQLHYCQHQLQPSGITELSQMESHQLCMLFSNPMQSSANSSQRREPAVLWWGIIHTDNPSCAWR